jgi:hypothetical protein
MAGGRRRGAASVGREGKEGAWQQRAPVRLGHGVRHERERERTREMGASERESEEKRRDE